jgi:hypothetical protein
MEKLISYIEMELKWAKLEPKTAESNFHNAFGAVQFYAIEHTLGGKEYTELETMWNGTYRPQFEALLWGGTENA